MKFPATFFAGALLLFALPAFANTDLTREEAGAIKSLDLQDVENKGPSLVDQIVKLKVTHRGTKPELQKDGSYTGTLMYYTTNIYMTGRTRFGEVQVSFPKEALDWFMKLPSLETRKSVLVYARLVKGNGSIIKAQLLGRELKTDLKGSHIEW